MNLFGELIEAFISPVTLMTEAWDKVVLAITGKRIAVLGPRGSGKSTLLNFLSTGVLNTDNEQTVSSQKVASNRFSMAELKFDLKSTIDVPGGPDAQEDWQRVYNSSDYALYLIKASAIDNSRIQRDLGLAEKWKQALKKAKKKAPELIVIVTHMDRVDGYLTVSSSGKGDFRDNFIRNNLEAGLSRLQTRPTVILGSFDVQDRMKATVKNLIQVMGTL
jgi:tRNA U34 5-carboxymethylaminomethyl modifying GTPase MnmE/TrmE